MGVSGGIGVCHKNLSDFTPATLESEINIPQVNGLPKVSLLTLVTLFLPEISLASSLTRLDTQSYY